LSPEISPAKTIMLEPFKDKLESTSANAVDYGKKKAESVRQTYLYPSHVEKVFSRYHSDSDNTNPNPHPYSNT
jgi:SAM-dependent MidA family methyltransferase